MRKPLTALSILFISLAFVVPAPALAQTDTGPTPGSFWYGIITTFENINLFLTFNSEKKAEKALGYAERRLTQAKAAAEGENSKAVETALADYETKINLATESSKKIKDNERAEKLFTSIADNTSKHQEVLSEVLEKIPEEARGAIAKAIEASKRGQEEAMKQVTELKGEVEQLKNDIAELKQNDSDEQTAEIEKLKREVEELKKKPAATPPVVTPTPTTPQATPDKAFLNQTPPPIETWAELEARYFVSADQKGWTSQTITNALGEKRYYRKEGNQWVRKNSEAEATQPYEDFTRPAVAPSPTQLRRLMAMCSLSDELAATCNTQTFISGYFTNITFRTLVDELLIRAEQKLAEQKVQNELAQQRYLLYLQTINQPAIAPTTRYETYSLPVYSGGLKLESPQLNTPIKWNVQWTGGGAGFIQDSSGNTTNFQCDSLLGRCFSL
ncbi:MAG TPA: DUF5667 domain-containing protein [Candidatus Paceibacterota bacterium]